MSFSGNQYPNNAAKVITTRGDIVRGNSSGERSRYGIGAANTVLTSDGTDPAWAAHGGVPTTTKGDISGFSTTQARIPISTNNFSLYGDSSAALGLKWAASSTSTLTTTGDLLAASAANVLTRIAGGASGEILTGNGAGVLPTFQAASGGGGSLALVGSDVLTVAGTDLTVSFTAIPASEIAWLMCVFNMEVLGDALAQPTLARVNGLSTSTYDFDSLNIAGGSETISSNTGESAWRVANDANNGKRFGIFYVALNRVADKIHMLSDSCGELGTQWQGGHNTTSSQTTFTEISCPAQAGTFDADSRLDVYRCNI